MHINASKRSTEYSSLVYYAPNDSKKKEQEIWREFD